MSAKSSPIPSSAFNGASQPIEPRILVRSGSQLSVESDWEAVDIVTNQNYTSTNSPPPIVHDFSRPSVQVKEDAATVSAPKEHIVANKSDLSMSSSIVNMNGASSSASSSLEPLPSDASSQSSIHFDPPISSGDIEVDKIIKAKRVVREMRNIFGSSDISMFFQYMFADVECFDDAFRLIMAKIKPVNLVACVMDIIHAPPAQKASATLRMFELYGQFWRFKLTEVPCYVMEGFAYVMENLIAATGLFDSGDSSNIDDFSDTSSEPQLQSAVKVDPIKLAKFVNWMGVDEHQAALWLEQNPIVCYITLGFSALCVFFLGRTLIRSVKWLDDLFIDLARTGLQLKGLAQIGVSIRGIFKTLSGWFCKIIGIEYDLDYNPKYDAILDELTTVRDDLSDYRTSVTTDLQWIVHSGVFLQRTNDLINRSKRVQSRIAGHPKLNSKNWVGLINEVSKLTSFAYKYRSQYLITHSRRVQPIVVLLSGVPGVGKSYIVDHLIRLIAARLGKQNMSKYTRSPSDEYWSGYLGQEFVCYDDFGQFKEDLDHKELISIAGVNNYSLNMADIKDKGMSFISHFVFCCSNSYRFNSSEAVKDTVAINRRFDLRVVVKNQWVEDNRAANPAWRHVPGTPWQPSDYFMVQTDPLANESVSAEQPGHRGMVQLNLSALRERRAAVDQTPIGQEHLLPTNLETLCNQIVNMHQHRVQEFVRETRGNFQQMVDNINREVEGQVNLNNAAADIFMGNVDGLRQQIEIQQNHIQNLEMGQPQHEQHQQFINAVIEEPQLQAIIKEQHPTTATSFQGDFWLLQGPPGTGKTQMMMDVREYMKQRNISCIELIPSMERYPTVKEALTYGVVIFDDFSIDRRSVDYVISLITSAYKHESQCKILLSCNMERLRSLCGDSDSLRLLERRVKVVEFSFRKYWSWRKLAFVRYTAEDVEQLVDSRRQHEDMVQIKIRSTICNWPGALSYIKFFKTIPQTWSVKYTLQLSDKVPDFILSIDRTEMGFLSDLLQVTDVASLIKYVMAHFKVDKGSVSPYIGLLTNFLTQAKTMLTAHAARDKDDDSVRTNLYDGLCMMNARHFKAGKFSKCLCLRLLDTSFLMYNDGGYIKFALSSKPQFNQDLTTTDVHAELTSDEKTAHWFRLGYEKILHDYPAFKYVCMFVNAATTLGLAGFGMYAEIMRYNEIKKRHFDEFEGVVEEICEDIKHDLNPFVPQSTAPAKVSRLVRRSAIKGMAKRNMSAESDTLHLGPRIPIVSAVGWSEEGARRKKRVYDTTVLYKEEPKEMILESRREEDRYVHRKFARRTRQSRHGRGRWTQQCSIGLQMFEFEDIDLLKKFYDEVQKLPRNKTRYTNRETIWFGNFDYSFSQHTMKAAKAPSWLMELEELLIDEGVELTDLHRGNVLINIYRDGNDYVGWHADNEFCIDSDSSIISLSLGAKRCFQIRKAGTKDIEEIELPHASVLVMPPHFQKSYQHRLAPDPSCNEARINFTWRVYTDRASEPELQSALGFEDESLMEFQAVNQNVLNLLNLVYRNMGNLTTDTGLNVCSALMLFENYGVSVAHAFVKFNENELLFVDADNVKWTVSVVKKDIHKEICIFKVSDRKFQNVKDIRIHLLNKDSTSEICDQLGILILRRCIANKWCPYMIQVKIHWIKEMQIDNQIREGYIYGGHVTGLQIDGISLTTLGDCGGVLISCSPRRMPRIAGIHFAAQSTLGIASVMYKELFEPEMWQLQCAKFEEPEVKYIDADEWEEFEEYILDGEMRIIGATNLDTQRALTSCEYRSPLACDKYGDNYEPAVMEIFDDRVEQSVAPIRLAVQRWGHQKPRIDDIELSIVVDEIAHYLSNMIKTHGESCKVLTKKEAINAPSEYARAKPIFRQSSAGYPWSLFAGVTKKNNYIVPAINAKVEHMVLNLSHPLGIKLNLAIDQMIDAARHHCRTGAVFQAHLKDEVLKKKKIYDKVDTRLISGAPLHLVIAHRMYFYASIASLSGIQEYIPPKIGINPTSLDWSQLYHYLSEMSTVGFDADFKNWDANVPKQIMEKLPIIYNKIYQVTDKNWKEEDDVIRYYLHSHMHGPLMMVDDAIVQSPGGQVSGQPGTSMDNSIVNMIYYFLAWRYIMRKYDRPDMVSWTAFQNNVRFAVYGDDNIAAVSNEVLKEFNLKTFSEYCASVLKVECTDASKSKDLYEFRSLMECEFLKRKFKRISENIIVGPVVDSVLDKMLNWCTYGKGKRVNRKNVFEICFDLETIEQTCDELIEEAALRGQQDYNFIYHHCSQRLLELNSRHILKTYIACLEDRGIPPKLI